MHAAVRHFPIVNVDAVMSANERDRYLHRRDLYEKST
jgi:hypothetical protein